MPKRKKLIETYHSRGDQRGENSASVWFNHCGESESIERGKVTDRGEWLKTQGFQVGVQPGYLDVIQNRLNAYIKEDDSANLKRLLQLDYIYPGVIDRQSDGDNDHSRGEWDHTLYEVYWTRPILEALFVEKKIHLTAIIKSIILQDNPDIYAAFMESLQGTDIPARQVFAWDEAMKKNTIDQLNMLKQYGSRLSEKDTYSMDKRKESLTIAEQLIDKIKDYQCAPASEQKALFKNLEFKLSVMSLLQSRDKTFEKHRGYKRIITNVLTILFTGGLANFMNRMVTGNWMFFNKTTTQEKITNIQSAVGYVLK